jgi:hypothetical protein
MIDKEAKIVECFSNIKAHLEQYLDEGQIDEIDENILENIRIKILKAFTDWDGRKPEEDNAEDYDMVHYPEICPVCGSKGILSGYTEIFFNLPSNAEDDVDLIFHPEKFKCNTCNLYLDYYDELMYVGLDRYPNRKGELDKWLKEYGKEYYEKRKEESKKWEIDMKEYKKFMEDHDFEFNENSE